MRSLFLLPALLLAADNPGGGAAAAKPPSLDAQLTASQTRVTELEGLQTAWTGERTQLTAARDDLQTQVTNLTGQVNSLTGERNAAQASVTDLTTKLTAANGSITTLTGERDAAVALSKNPSAQAGAILAQAGAPAVPVKVEATKSHAENGNTHASATGKRGLSAAIAKNVARANENKR